MATSQTEKATDNKQDSEESGAVQESGGEKSKPQEPAAVEAPAEEAAAEQGAEETQDQKAADDKADSEEKAEAETEAKPEAEEKAKVAEEKDKPEAEAKVEAEEKAEGEEKAEAEVEAEAAEEPKAETEEKTEAETEAKPEAEEKAEATEEKDKPEAEALVAAKPRDAAGKVEAEEKVEAVEEKTEAEPEAEEKVKAEEKTSVPDQSQESATGEISETIQQMTRSPAVLPGESGKPTMAHISVSSGVCAKEIMQKEVIWANSEESVQQVLTKMQQQDSSYIMVGQDGALEGIVSKSDITGASSIYLRPIFAKWHGPLDDATLQIKLKWIMSRPVRTVRPETPLETIIENICRFGGRGLPVVDEQGKVQGLVTVFDIFRTLLNTSEDASAVGKTAEAPALA